MNYPRVNLLNKGERRYQGAVSQRFMLISIVVTPIMLIAALSGIKMLQYASVKSQLQSNREIWAALEPRQARYMEEQRGLNANRQALELVHGWQKSKCDMIVLLEEIQNDVPEEIQLTRLSIKSSDQKSVFASTADLALTFTLALQGLSQGDRAEDNVITLRKDLLEASAIASTFETVKLVSMRKRAGQAGENLREFSLEGTAAEGGRP